uniref:NACHT domain-containing protein n=1 Tax=Lates calcarifer TaxID=8187 RepID=A0A4W6DMS5_LATCA
MDEEVDPGDENVNSVLAQESSELFDVLSCQSPTVIMRLCQMMPSGAGWNMGHLAPTSSSAAVTERIKAMLEYFRVASAADCRNFLQSMCILCENIPMRLESRLMSVAGYANSEYEMYSALNEESPLSPSEQQLIKRPRIDHWEQYIASVVSLMLRKWERLSEGLVREVQLENVWVSLRTTNRGRDRPDQTPGPADRGSRTPEPDGDFGSLESKVTLETFLQGCAGKVTVVAGQPGSGKTLLMSCLGQQWAHGLGPIPSSYLFVLLEFRQLNLISSPLSLSELLLRYYLPPKRGDNEKRAIVDYLLSNPEQSCWVLDGYDEFNSKLTRQEVQRKPLDPEKALPVADLISGLLNRQLLPGCTVLVTSRVRDVRDLEGISDKVGQLLGWDRYEIKEYVVNFFGVKGKTNRALGVQAADLLLSSRHLLAMSYLPALCNICCICLKHLLLEAETKLQPGDREEERGNETRKKATEKELKEGQIAGERRGGSQDITRDGTNGRAQLPPTPAQIPSTLTQVYLTVLGAFLSHHSGKKGNSDKAKTTKPPQSLNSVFTLSQYQSELCELSQLAWRGLEENKVLFLKEDIPQDVLEFSVTTGLLSQVELRLEDGILVNAYCFIHLTIQEFLAALRIMTSNDVSDAQLRKRFSLKTRWMTKSDQRTVFTDSLHTFVCGLASQHCTAALLQMARASGGTGVQTWVQKRQALVLKLLKNLCHSNTLTGPKILELCHCVQESQDHQLAKEVVGTRPTLELRNIRLLPNDIDALAFVVNSVGDNGIGLDFGACSMELECLDVLPRCQYIHYLSFRSRKYGDKFAEKLSSILPELTTLRKLEFCGASLTATGAASLASALEKCPDINEINLSDNSLKDEGMQHIADIFTKLPRLASVMLSRNNSSLKAVDYLIGKMSSCLNIQHLHAEYDYTHIHIHTHTQLQVSLFFYKTKSEPTISLLNQKWSKPEMQKVAKSLACCPTLSVLDMSGGQWNVEILRTLTQFLPKFSVTNKIILNDSCSSVEGLVVLTGLLSNCPAVVELHIRYKLTRNLSSCVSVVNSDITLSNNSEFFIRSCVLSALFLASDNNFTFFIISLSSNRLGNKGLRKLLDVLPHLSNIQEIKKKAVNNFFKNRGMEGVVMLAGTLGSSNSLREIHIRYSLFYVLAFNDSVRTPTELNNSILLPSDVTTLCRRLVECRSHLELDLSHSSLEDEAIKNLLKVLPEMVSLQRLNLSSNQLKDEGVKCLMDSLPRLKITSFVNLSNNSLTQQGLLYVASTLCTCDNISGVEVRKRCLIWFRHHRDSEKTLSIRESRLEREHLVRLAEISSNFAHVLQEADVNLPSLPFLSPPLPFSLVDCALEGHQLASMWTIIQRCPSLTELDFSINSLGIEGAESLSSVLPSLPNLTSLSIVSKETCKAVAEKLSEALLQSTTVQLHLAILMWIVCVCVCACVRVRARLNKIGTVMEPPEANSVLDLLHAMEGLKQMQEIELKGWRLADRAVEQMTRLFPVWTELRKISLSKTLNGDQSGDKLLGALISCSHLEELYLCGNGLGDLTAARMALVLPSMTHLTVLDISENTIGCEGSVSLSKAIICMKNLTKIQLTSVGTSELCAVASSLAHCPLIQDVGLGWNNCGDEVALELARVLPFCQKLNRIDLEANIVTVFGVDALVRALQSCPAVQLIKLWRNKVHPNEAHRLSLKDRRLNFSST